MNAGFDLDDLAVTHVIDVIFHAVRRQQQCIAFGLVLSTFLLFLQLFLFQLAFFQFCFGQRRRDHLFRKTFLADDGNLGLSAFLRRRVAIVPLAGGIFAFFDFWTLVVVSVD